MNECEMQIQLRQPAQTPLPTKSSSSSPSQAVHHHHHHRSRLETELNLQKQKHVLDLKRNPSPLHPTASAAAVQHLLESFDSRCGRTPAKCINMSSEQARGIPLIAQQQHNHHTSNGIDLSPRTTQRTAVAGHHQLGSKMGEPKRTLSDQSSSKQRTSNSINNNSSNTNGSIVNHSSPSSASSGSSDCNSPPSNGSGNGVGGGNGGGGSSSGGATGLNGSAKSGNGGRLQFFKGELGFCFCIIHLTIEASVTVIDCLKFELFPHIDRIVDFHSSLLPVSF